MCAACERRSPDGMRSPFEDFSRWDGAIRVASCDKHERAQCVRKEEGRREGRSEKNERREYSLQ